MQSRREWFKSSIGLGGLMMTPSILTAEEIKILKVRNDRQKEVSQSQSRKTQKISKEKLKSEQISFPWHESHILHELGARTKHELQRNIIL